MLPPFDGPDRDHFEADLPGVAIRPDSDALRLDRRSASGRLLDGDSEGGRQPFPRHPEEVEARDARGGLEIRARLSSELHDLHVGVHHDRRRRVSPQDAVGLPIDRSVLPANGVRRRRRPAGVLRRASPIAEGDAEPQVDRGRRLPRVDLVCPVDDREEVGEPPDALGNAELEKAGGLQGVVEDREDALLQRGAEVDQHVAATDEVELGERRVPRQVLLREYTGLPDRLADLIAAVRGHEEALQPLGRDLVLDALGERAGPGAGDRGSAEVGREHLDRQDAPRLPEELHQGDDQRVRLLPRGAARHPDPDRLVGGPLLQESREDAPPEGRVTFRVPEESRHLDQDVVVERLGLPGRLPEKTDIRLEVVDLLEQHAAGDPAPHGAWLVLREIDAGRGAEGPEDGGDVVATHRLIRDDRGGHGLANVRVTSDPRQLAGDPRGRQGGVGDPGRAQGHAGVRRGLRVLDEADAPRRLDRAETQRAVRARSRQHHTDRAAVLLLREGLEEPVDRHVAVPGDPGREGEEPSGDRHVPVRRDHVDVVGLRAEALGDRDDRHRGRLGQELGQPALVPGIQMLDQHEHQPGPGGQLLQEPTDGLETASGCADADDRERGPARRQRATVGGHGLRRSGSGRAPRGRLRGGPLASALAYHQEILSRAFSG